MIDDHQIGALASANDIRTHLAQLARHLAALRYLGLVDFVLEIEHRVGLIETAVREYRGLDGKEVGGG